MSIVGDRLTVTGPMGHARVERTEQGVRVNGPSELSIGQARQLSRALDVMAGGSPMGNRQGQISQGGQGFQQGGQGNWGQGQGGQGGQSQY